jgi:hypothetical protein
VTSSDFGFGIALRGFAAAGLAAVFLATFAGFLDVSLTIALTSTDRRIKGTRYYRKYAAEMLL